MPVIDSQAAEEQYEGATVIEPLRGVDGGADSVMLKFCWPNPQVTTTCRLPRLTLAPCTRPS